MAITINTIEELDEIGEQLGLGRQEGEFATIVEITQGLLGVDLAGVDEDEEAVTREGLAALARLLGSKNLGIDTTEGRKTAIVAGLTRRAAKKLLEAYREDQRWENIGP